MCSKIIFHIDVNSAFLSWEAVYRIKILGAQKDLREIPSAVAGDIKKRHGIILAKSVPAKKYGIQTGEMIGDALKKCPHLELVPPHYQLYKKSSEAFMEILRRFCPVVEQFSIDEAYCDMTGTIGLYGSSVAVANIIKDTIYKELGFTVNIGISNNKLLAKIASDFKKPNLVHTLFPEEIEKKMWPLPVSDLFFVGRATAKKLFALGIKTIGDLANAEEAMLKSHLKKQGEIIYQFANGIDASPVVGEQPLFKGYGNSTTIAFDVDKTEAAKQVLLSLCETVGKRLRDDNASATVLSISIVYFDFNHISAQTTLISPTNITNELYEEACKLFDRLWDGMAIRNLGVHTTRIVRNFQNRQLSLFDHDQFEKLEKLDRAVDKIRDKYGVDSLKRASFINSPIYHMTGGIGKEKQTVNYEEVKLE